MGVLDKAVSLLGCLEAGPRTLAEAAGATGIPRATAHRLLVSLESHGLASRELDGRFGLGPALVRLGAAAMGASGMVDAARPTLEHLRDVTGESAQLYVRSGEGRVCVASLESPHSLRTIVAVGAVLPLDRGSAGAVLRDEHAARARGWAESVEEREAGVASVSAPVRRRRAGVGAESDGGQVLAAVSVSGPVERTTRQPGARYSASVLAAARQIELALGLDA
jgi:DNA-binding IclR family transcriptional regulator